MGFPFFDWRFLSKRFKIQKHKFPIDDRKQQNSKDSLLMIENSKTQKTHWLLCRTSGEWFGNRFEAQVISDYRWVRWSNFMEECRLEPTFLQNQDLTDWKLSGWTPQKMVMPWMLCHILAQTLTFSCQEKAFSLCPKMLRSKLWSLFNTKKSTAKVITGSLLANLYTFYWPEDIHGRYSEDDSSRYSTTRFGYWQLAI